MSKITVLYGLVGISTGLYSEIVYPGILDPSNGLLNEVVGNLRVALVLVGYALVEPADIEVFFIIFRCMGYWNRISTLFHCMPTHQMAGSAGRLSCVTGTTPRGSGFLWEANEFGN